MIHCTINDMSNTDKVNIEQDTYCCSESSTVPHCDRMLGGITKLTDLLSMCTMLAQSNSLKFPGLHM